MPLGIPHSEFLAWSEEDQDKALMFQREMATVCKGCGTREADWAENPDAFVGDIRECPGCARLEDERENAEGLKGAHLGLVTQEQALAKAEKMGDVKREDEDDVAT